MAINPNCFWQDLRFNENIAQMGGNYVYGQWNDICNKLKAKKQ